MLTEMGIELSKRVHDIENAYINGHWIVHKGTEYRKMLTEMGIELFTRVHDIENAYINWDWIVHKGTAYRKCLHKWALNCSQGYRVQKMLTLTEIELFTRVQHIENAYINRDWIVHKGTTYRKCLHKWALNCSQGYRVQKMLTLTEIELFTRVQHIENAYINGHWIVHKGTWYRKCLHKWALNCSQGYMI